MASRGALVVACCRSSIPLAAFAVCWLALVPSSFGQESPAPRAEPPPSTAAENPTAPPDESPPPDEAPLVPAVPVAPTIAREPVRQSPPTRLADPVIARKLELTTEQQAEIARLMAERATALAAGDEAGRPPLEALNNEQLLAVLDENQRVQWQKMAREEVRRLKFSFRFQPWADVLQWFAEQSDLSLVLDAPPPGTFNYTDNREYTVPEAIDLINGVLLTKGYTLVRRDRMLMVLNVGEDLPTDLIPRVDVDELDERGRFELVSVVFPLANRDAAEVDAEIKPLLGPHGKTAVMAKTRQLLVTDMAGKMRSIAAVIESIPLPKGPSAPSDKPGKPMLTTYPLESLDVAAALEVLKVMLPDAKVVVDKGGNLLVTAPPEQQESVAQLLAQLKANVSPEDSPRLESYPVKQAFRAELTQILSPVAPGATLSVDSRTGHLLVFGNSQQQAAVERTLAQLGRSADNTDQKIEIYPLEHAEPTAVLAVIKQLLPQSQVVVNAATRSLVAVGDAAEHTAIRAAIERLEAEQPEVERRQIAIYPLTGSEPTTLTTILAGLLPQAQVTIDTVRRELVAVALPPEHDRIKAILAQLAQTPDEPLDLKFYPIQLTNSTAAITLLAKLAPTAQVTVDAASKRLVVLAQAKDHEQVAATLAAIEEGTAVEGPTLVVYPLNQTQSKKLQAVLTALATDLVGLRSVPDAETGNLSVWATPEQHEQVRKILEQVTREVPESERPRIVVYPVPDADPIALSSMLQAVAPGARLSGDRQNSSLAVWGTPDEQELIKPAIDAMLKRYPPGREPTLTVYRVDRAEIANVLVLLRGIVPQAQVTADTKNGNLVAWGTAEEHGKIRATLDGLASAAAEDTLVAEVYSAPETDAATLLLLLQAAAPDARLVANTRANTVIAWARADQHAALQETLKHLGDVPGADGRRSAKVYRFRHADANAALVVLRTLVPTAQLAVDTRTGSLAATALPSEHQLIETTVAELEGEGLASDNFELQVYPLEQQDPASALAIARDLFAQRPEVRLSLDSLGGKLVAWAAPAQQKMIRTMLDSLQAASAGGDRRQVETYQLDTADSASVTTVLTNLFGSDRNVRIVADRSGGTVTVMAPPEVQATVRATIEQMRGQSDEFDVIPLRVVDAFNAAASIRSLFGDPDDRQSAGAPHVDADPDAQQIVVRGSKQQLARIRELLTKMGEPALTADASGPGRKMRVIQLGGRAARSAVEEIERVWPQLRGNPIRVVTPSAVVPTMKERSKKSDQQQPSDETESPPAPAAETLPKVSSNTSFSPVLWGAGHVAAQPSSAAGEELLAFAFEEPAQPPATSATDPHAAEPEPPVAIADDELAPIVIAPGEDSITIASDDLDALNQFEELFKAISQRYGAAGREFTVFTLKRADVMVVAQTLDRLFEGGSFGFRASNVTIVPDQRLNALVVQGNRNELATIEGLLEVLDTADAPDSVAARKPRLIAVKNSSAVEIAEVVRETYKTQLTATNAKRQSRNIRGVSSGLAELINQLNPESDGPEMTLSIDTATNSLVVMAAGPLFDEVQTLVESLDSSAGNGTRTVKVVPLTKTNSKAMQAALKSLFEDRRRRDRGSRNP